MIGSLVMASLVVLGRQQQQVAPLNPFPQTTTQGSVVVAGAPTTTLVNARIDEPFTLGALRYRIVSINEGLKDYTLKYDQRQTRLTPGYKMDRLVAVEVEAENPTDLPASPAMVTPALSDEEGSMTDRAWWDIRQRSFIKTGRNDDTNLNTISGTMTGTVTGVNVSDAILVAPHGKVRFALVFSQPESAKAGRLQLSSASNGFGAPSTIGMVTLSRAQ